MGAKVNPNGLRFGINKEWQSRWVAKDNKQVAEWLVQEDKIRTSLINKYKNARIDHIEIERTQDSITLFVYAAQPGVILGTENAELNKAILLVNKIVGRKIKVSINVIAIENSSLCARIIAREIADAIENRVSFRNAQKAAIRKVLRSGAKGVKTHVSGRLGGVEMAREEGYSEGVVTLSTLRADIDYALEEAHTTYGIIGVKVWINRGEIFKKDLNQRRSNSQNSRNSRSNLNKDNKEKRSNSSTKAQAAGTQTRKPRAPRANATNQAKESN